MESPLTQQARPDAFEPKIVQHYLYLFTILPNENEDETLPSEGFWRELFLLKPDKRRLSDILDPLTANDLLHIQVCRIRHCSKDCQTELVSSFTRACSFKEL